MLLFTLNNLNGLEGGLVNIGIGTLASLFFRHEHKKYIKEGFKQFGKNERKEGQTLLQQILFVELGTRSRLGLYFGYIFIIMGTIEIFNYFIKSS